MKRTLEAYLNDLEKALPYPPAVCEQIVSEVRDHLLALVEKGRDAGLGAREAEMQAMRAFGTVEDFVTRFEEEGGPVESTKRAFRWFGASIGAYCGVIAGTFTSTRIGQPWPVLAGTLLGAWLGLVGIVRANLGILVGAALGAVIGSVAVANYLVFHDRWMSGSNPSSIATTYFWSPIIGALIGLSIGLLRRLRRDPSPLLWATLVGLAFHVAARLWLEDAPSLTGLSAVALGAVAGLALGSRALGRRYVTVPLGVMIGAAVGNAAIIPVILVAQRIAVSPGAILAIPAFVGGLVGLLLATGVRADSVSAVT